MKFFVGDYTHLGGPGIALCRLDGGSMHIVESVPDVKDPSYAILTRDQKTLYVTGEADAEAAAFDVSDGHLHLVSKQSTKGKAACHLTLSPDERFLYTANYSSGSLSVFPVDKAQIGKCIQLIEHEGYGPNAERQECAHVHFVAFDPADEQLLYAVDLGIDAVMIYRQNPETGHLTACDRVNVEPGMGPRHLIFHGENMMYVAHELGNAVSAFRRTDTGWKHLQTLSTLPEDWRGESSVAAIRIHGSRLFASNRGHDSLAVFDIGTDGTLQLAGVRSTMGRNPRDFYILPDGRILAAHQDSGDVRLLEAAGANASSPEFTQICDPLALSGAVCVCPMLE